MDVVKQAHIFGWGEPIWGVCFDETVHFKPRVDAIICSSCDSVTLGLLPELDVESFRPIPEFIKPSFKILLTPAQRESDEKRRLANRSDEEKRIDELEEKNLLLSRNIVSRFRNRSLIRAIQEDLNQMHHFEREKQKKKQDWRRFRNGKRKGKYGSKQVMSIMRISVC